jgi:cytochrome b6-f complex iron-sulfur subunit
VGGPDRVSLKAGDGMRNPQEDRRTFLSQLLTGSLLVSLIGVLGTVIAYLFPPERRVFNPARRRMRVARTDEIPLGKGKQVLFDGEPVWVLHLKGGWSAFSAICTHQGCIVHWDEKRRTLTCPCHAGVFDANGNVLSGPPPRPLKRFRVALVRDELYLGPGEG